MHVIVISRHIEIASVVILLYSRPVVCTGLQGGRGEMALRGHNRRPGGGGGGWLMLFPLG